MSALAHQPLEYRWIRRRASRAAGNRFVASRLIVGQWSLVIGLSTSACAPAVDSNGPCEAAAPFGSPVPIDELNSQAAEGPPQLSHDEQTIYFSRTTSSGKSDILVATRSSRTGSFGAPKTLGLKVAKAELSPSPTSDGLGLYFAANANYPIFGIYVASRANERAEFTAASPLSRLDDGSAETLSPYIMPGAKALYYATLKDALGGEVGTDLRRATGSSSSFDLDTFDAFVNVNTSHFETSPAVTTDELAVYFASDREGWRVFRATRAKKTEAFDEPEAVSELGSMHAQPGWISDDGCRLYFARDDANGDANLYVASKTSAQ